MKHDWKANSGKADISEVFDSRDFGFRNDEKNRQQVKDCLVRKTEDIRGIVERPGYQFFMTGDWSKAGELVLFHEKRGELSYYVEFELIKLPLLGIVPAVQVRIWRRVGDVAVHGITSKIFFDVLLKRFGLVVSDDRLTKDGQGFWKAVMAQADDRGFNVGYIISEVEAKLEYKPEGIHIIDWVLAFDRAWEAGDKSRGLRFLVSQ